MRGGLHSFFGLIGLLSFWACSEEAHDRTNAEMNYIFISIFAFHDQEERWPRESRELEEIAKRSAGNDRWGHAYVVTYLTPGRYLIQSAGEDGVYDSFDDVLMIASSDTWGNINENEKMMPARHQE